MPLWIWEQPDWPSFRWNEGEVGQALSQARLAQGQVQGAASLLDPNLARDAAAAILVDDSITTSAIEGEHLDLDSVRSSVARHLGLSTEGLPAPPRSVDGLIDVLVDATHNFSEPLSLERLFGWQAALFPTGYSGLVQIRTGELRGEEPMRVMSGRMGREKVHFEAPPRDRLEDELDRFLAWFAAPPTNLDGLIRAGIAHLWFVTLHPFEDGNGRLARALTDMAIAQDEGLTMRLFSLSAQLSEERDAYHTGLESAQRGGLDVTPRLVWFLNQVAAACTRSQATVARTLAKARFWLHFQEVDISDRQRKVLNRLLDAGPDGFEGGMTNRKYIGMTKTSRATAYRELSDLVVKGFLVATEKGGRSSAYAIPWKRFLHHQG